LPRLIRGKGEAMQDPQMIGGGAKCAVHVDRIATRTCARCGNFTCDECNLGGSETQCPACRAISGSDAWPFSRDAYSFDGIWTQALERFKAEWIMLSVSVLILMAVGMVAGIFNSIFQTVARLAIGERGGTMGIIWVTVVSTLMSQLVSMIIQGTFTMGLFRIIIDVLQGKKADVGRILTQLPKLPRYIVQTFLFFVMIGLPMLLYVVLLGVVASVVTGVGLSDPSNFARLFKGAGIGVLVIGFLAALPIIYYFTLPLMFATMELVYGDSPPVESIRRAFVIARGHRWSIIGFGLISLLVVLVGLLACCVGIIPAVALVYMLLVGLYLSLRNGSGLPPPVES